VRRTAALFVWLWVFGPWLMPPSAQAAPAPAGNTTEQWRVFEITLTSTRAYANPFADVSVTAVFTSPSGLTLQRPAFWDGGDTWKVRAALTEVGRWTYRVTASDPANAGLNTALAAVRCIPYTGRQAIYQHGFLQVSANRRYLAHANGLPFFWLGDTHWFFDLNEHWDTSNDPRWPSQFRALVDRRVQQGFSVYQSVIFGPSPSYWAPGEVGERINPDYFRDQLDPKLAYIADQGLVNAFGLGFHSNIDNNVTTLVRLARYLVARYGAYPMVWITGGEVAGYDPAQEAARLDGWRQVALAIDAADDYHQPQSAHYTNDFPTYYQGESWFDFTMVQGGHAGLADTANYRAYYQAADYVPLLEAESNYEGFFANITAEVVRVAAYRAIQAGSFGYTYGAQGIWNATWDEADTANDFTTAHWNWFEAIDFPGGAQMTYLARFYRRLPWATLAPRPAGWADFPPQLSDADRPLVKADEAGTNVVVYFPASYDPAELAGTLVNLPDQTYNLRWYNPRTGRWLYAGAARLGVGQWRIEPKPDGADWLLWLEATRPTGPDPDLARAQAQPNLAAGQQYRSSMDGAAEHGAAKAFDGDPATYWQPAATEPYAAHWLEVDFGRPVTITAAAIIEEDYHTRGFRLDVWTGAAWETAYTGHLIGHLQPRLFQFPARAGSRVRLVFTTGVATPLILEWALYDLPDLDQGRAAWKK